MGNVYVPAKLIKPLARRDRAQNNMHTFFELLPPVPRTVWTLLVGIQDDSLFYETEGRGRRVRMVIIPTFPSLSCMATFTGGALNAAHSF